MTHEERNKIANEIIKECLSVLNAKGADYAGHKDSLANFKRNAERLGLSKYEIWGVYFNKHIDAINNSIQANPETPQVESEPLEGRIIDAINYLLIFAAMLKEDER